MIGARPSPITLGVEWAIEAAGCERELLRDAATVERFLDAVMTAASLTAARPPVVHRFPEPGGVTALVLLTESHLAIHTFPEHGALTLNLHCCRPRQRLDWENVLAEFFRATHVRVRELDRELDTSEAPATGVDDA